jgi:hypothetical protein
MDQQEKKRELLRLLRQDNPILALGVQEKELSWSSFMAWLFDPARQASYSSYFLHELLLRVRSSSWLDLQNRMPSISPTELTIISSKTEHPVTSGRIDEQVGRWWWRRFHAVSCCRIDVLVRFECRGLKVALVIENKIWADESPEQLSGYLSDLKKGKDMLGTSLIPLFICLGKSPGKCSAREDAIQTREDIKAWLHAAIGSCQQARIEPPLLAQNYLQLLDVYDLASDLMADDNFIKQFLLEVKLKLKNPDSYAASDEKLLMQYCEP